MMGLSMLAAPILAGTLVEANVWGTGWRLVFLINLPIGVATFTAGLRALPRTVTHPDVRLDIVGTILIGLSLTALIYPLIQGRTAGWPSWTFISLAGGLVLLAAFVLWERRRRGDPLIETSLITNRSYTSGILVILAFFGAFSGLVLSVSIFVQVGERLSPTHAGLTLTPMVIGMIAGMAGGLALVARLGRHLLHLGIAVVAAGAVALALTMASAQTASVWDLTPPLLLMGIGFGASVGQLFDFIVAGVSLDEVCSASGVLEAVQQLSTATGAAVLGTIYFAAAGTHAPTHALSITAWACLIPIVVTFGLLYRLPLHARQSEH
jgi:predicted MFS family arabinose efflux permease